MALRSLRPASAWTPLLAGVVLAFTHAVCAPTPAVAQSVTGTVVDASSEAPVTGVLVSLLDEAGERVRGVLTDEAGGFSLEVGRFGRYRLEAQRIGLETTSSELFELFTLNPHEVRLVMGDRPVLIPGLVVDARVQQCRNDPREAVQIQQWWLEVRTALDVSSVVQDEAMAQFSIERFERKWDDDLRRIVSADSRSEVSLTNRPFVSAEAEFLSEGGFIQGTDYYAPDADVLLSDVFLSEHCFGIEDHDDDRLIGLAFRPTGGDLPDITGTLWVDSTTAELRSLDFRYANREAPGDEAGGYVAFEYLPSGMWIVSDWYIRMPRLGFRSAGPRPGLVLLGYVDVGGRVTPLESAAVSRDRLGEVGSIRGEVYDSIRGRGLEGALVTILGTRFQTRTDTTGSYLMTNVPVGEHQLTFFHDDPEAWGLGSPFVEVEVGAGRTTVANLALPSFRQAARVVCVGSGSTAEAVLLGHLVDAAGAGLGGITLELTWRETRYRGQPFDMSQEIGTGSDGRFVACTVPGEVPIAVRAQIEGVWIEGFEVTVPMHDIVYRRMMVPVGQ